MKIAIFSLFIINLVTIKSFSAEKLNVEITSKNSFEKLCVVQLFDETLAVEQKPTFEGSNDELSIQFSLSTSGESSDRLSPELRKMVSASSIKYLTVSRTDSTGIDLKTLLASNDLKTILSELLVDTAYNKGGTFSLLINVDSIADALRAQCK
jgi:hypothetical protein